MIRRSLLVLLLLFACSRCHAGSPFNVLNAGDFSGTATVDYQHHCNATADASGINFSNHGDAARIDSITLGGVEYQATVYWSDNARLVYSIRKNRGGWKRYVCDGTAGLPSISGTVGDAHYSCSIGIDPDGYVHLSYNMWADPIKYRRSTLPITDGSFAGALEAESSPTAQVVSYLRFFRDRGDSSFYMTFRNGTSSDGDIYFLEFDLGTETWSGAPGTSTDGYLINGAGDTVYHSSCAFTSDWDGAGDGWMALPFFWKITDDPDVYEDPSVVFWDGTNFKKSDGTAQTVPITKANCDKLEAIAAGTAVNRPQIAADSVGRLHAVYRKGNTAYLYHRLWTEASGSWTTNTAATDGVAGNIDVVVDDDGVCSIIFVDTSNKKISRYYSGADNYSSWTGPTVVWNEAHTLDLMRPFHDINLWETKREYMGPVPFAANNWKPYLHDGMVGYWRLEETSGSRVDSSGNAQLLSDNATVTSGTGKIGTAADFEQANSEFLSRSDNADLSVTGDFTIGFWANLESKTDTRGAVGKYNTAGDQRSYLVQYGSVSDRFGFTVSATGNSTTVGVTGTNGGSPSTGAWYLVLAKHDAANDQLSININDGTDDTQAHSTGVYDGTAVFTLGRGSATATASQHFDGLIDEAFLITKVTTSGEDAWLYNSGSGRPYADFNTVAPTIYSHGATASVNVDAGNTAVATVTAYGDLTMGEALSGTDAADFGVTDNGDGTWSLAFDSAATAGTYTFTLTLDNAAGTDGVDFTVNVAGESGLLKAILLYSSLDRQSRQQSHFDRYGVYSLLP